MHESICALISASSVVIGEKVWRGGIALFIFTLTESPAGRESPRNRIMNADIKSSAHSRGVQ